MFYILSRLTEIRSFSFIGITSAFLCNLCSPGSFNGVPGWSVMIFKWIMNWTNFFSFIGCLPTKAKASEQYQIHKSLTTQMNWNFLILFHRKILLWCMPCWQILWTRRCRCYLQLLLSGWWQYPLNTFWIVAEHTCISAGASFCKSCAPGSYSEAAGTAAFEINITHTSAAYLLQLSVFAFRNNI